MLSIRMKQAITTFHMVDLVESISEFHFRKVTFGINVIDEQMESLSAFNHRSVTDAE